MTALTALGYAAAVCTTLAFVPQVIRVHRTRSADDISGAMYALFIAGLALWIVYGWLLAAWPIVIANTITGALAAWILVLKWRFARQRRNPDA